MPVISVKLVSWEGIVRMVIRDRMIDPNARVTIVMTKALQASGQCVHSLSRLGEPVSLDCLRDFGAEVI